MSRTQGRNLALVAAVAVTFFAAGRLSGLPTRTYQARTFAVIRIVDGDTFDVTAAGKAMRIRIAAIDTAERGEPTADEATEYLRQLIEGKRVRLSFEDIKPRRWIYGYPVGPFGRLLAHPHVEIDGESVDVGEEMIDSGHAVRWPRRKGK